MSVEIKIPRTVQIIVKVVSHDSLFLLRSKYSKLINDAMAGGNVVISLSLRESTRNSWH